MRVGLYYGSKTDILDLDNNVTHELQAWEYCFFISYLIEDILGIWKMEKGMIDL